MRIAELMGEVPPAARPPALCYHRVGGQLELGVTRVGSSIFARQMTTLARAGWKTLTLDQFAERLRPGHAALRTPHSAFLLTFDDGYASLAEHVYPILADVGFTATTFLITDYVGRLNTWDVRYTWHRLTWLSDDQAAAELERSREILRRRLGLEAAWAVAYPFGARDERIERLANAAGYELGFGGVHGNGSRLALARLPVYLWDVGSLPMGLREDGLGWLGRAVAHTANRCAVGTSMMQSLLPAPRSPLPASFIAGFPSPPPP